MPARRADAYRDESDALCRALHAYVQTRRAELGLTVHDLADAAGISERQVRALAYGGAPTLPTLIGLARALGVTLEKMLRDA